MLNIFGSCLFFVGLRQIVTDMRSVFYIKKPLWAVFYCTKNVVTDWLDLLCE